MITSEGGVFCIPFCLVSTLFAVLCYQIPASNNSCDTERIMSHFDLSQT